MSEEVSFPRSGPSGGEKKSKESGAIKKDKREHKSAESGSEPVKAAKESNLFQRKSESPKPKDGGKKKGRTGKDGKDSKKKKKEADNDEEDLKMTAAEAEALKGIAVAAPRFIPLLRYTNVERGMQMLGAVREIHELYALIALPNGLKGKLNITEYSDTLTEHISKNMSSKDKKDDDSDSDASDDATTNKMDTDSNALSFPSHMSQIFKVGQVIRVASITPADVASTTKQLELTMRESKLNAKKDSSIQTSGNVLPVSIKSAEDHGYIISTGLSKHTGFLPFDNIKKHAKIAFLGQRLDLAVDTFKSNVFTFKYDPSIANKPTTSDQVVTVDSLSPGMLVSATITKILKDGLWITFLDYFSGAVDVNHVALAKPDEDSPLVFGGAARLNEWFKEGEALQARILHIHPETKRIGLTTLPHLLSMTAFDFKAQVGDRIEDGEIQRVDEATGIAMTVAWTPKTEGEEDAKKDIKPITYRGYVPLAKVSDTKKDRVSESHYTLGSTKKVRIFGFNVLEGTLLLSHRKTDWKDPYLSYADVKVGELVEGTVKSVNSKGVVLTISSRVEAFCPRSHLSDVEVSDPESRFKVGSTIKARVLRVNAAEHAAFVTFKKSLIKSTLEIIKDYSVESGVWGHGCIVSILPTGLLIMFYNDTKGFVPLQELGASAAMSETFEKGPEAIVKALKDIYKVGQVVKCRVVESSSVANRMTVSFSTTVSATESEKAAAKAYVEKFKVGVVLKHLKVTKREEIGLMLSYNDEKEGVTVPVLIPLHHLSDHKELAKSKLETFKVGQIVDSLHIIARRRRLLIATLKPSILNAIAHKKFPGEFDNVKEGHIYAGYITKIFDQGVLVRWLDDLVAFVHISNLASGHHITNIHSEFYEDQSVTAEILAKDTQKMSLNASLRSPKTRTSDASYLHSYFNDLTSITKEKKEVDWTKLTVGSVLKAKVTQCENWGLMMEIPGVSKVSCFVHPSQTDGGLSAHEVGSTYQGLILDINYQKAICDVSLRSDLVKLSKKSSKSPASAGTSSDATIELVKRDYLILVLSDGQIVFAPARDFNTEGYLDPFQRFKAGTSVKVTIDKHTYRNIPLAFITESDATEEKKKKQQVSVFQSSSIQTLADVHVGKVIDAMVLTVHPHRVEFAIGGRVKAFLDMTAVDDIKLPKKCTLDTLLKTESSSKSKKSSKSSSISPLASELAEIRLPSDHPFSRFKPNQVVSGLKIHSFTEVRSDGTFLEGLKEIPKESSEESASPSKFQINLTLRQANEPPTLDSIFVGQIVPFWIHQITSSSLNGFVGRSLRGYCTALESSHSLNVASNLTANFKSGQVVLAAVTEVDKEKAKIQLSIRAVHQEEGVATSPSQLSTDRTSFVKVMGFRFPYLRVQAFDKTFGRVAVTDLNDVYDEKPLEVWTAKEGQFVEARLISTSTGKSEDGDLQYTFTLRKSMVSPSKKNVKAAPRIASYADVSPGTQYSGYISKHFPDKHFCFVFLGEGVVGHLPYAVIGTKFVKNPEKDFPTGSLVSGTVLKVEEESKKIDFAMRERAAKDPEQGVQVKFADLQVGQLVKGVVGNVQSFGVFIKIRKSKISALCHVSQLQDKPQDAGSRKSKHAKKQEEEKADNGEEKKDEDRLTLEQIQALFKVGDRVTAVIAKKDDTKRQLSLSMKASDILKAKKASNKMDSDDSSSSEESSSSDSDSGASKSSSSSSSDDEGDSETLNKALQKSSAKKRKAAELPDAASSEEDEDDIPASNGNAMAVDKKKSTTKQAASSSKKAKSADHEEVDSEEEHISLHPGKNGDKDEESSDDDSSSSSNSASGSASASESGSGSGEEDSDDEDDEAVGGLSSSVQWGDLNFKKGSKNAATASNAMDMDLDEDSSEDNVPQKKQQQKKKMTLQEEIGEEEAVMAKERALLGENKLETDADFERALISTPNSSYVWTRWIAQKIHDGDVQKARDTAEKALRRIDDREDDEKFNVWVVYLNLENRYGTRESFSILLRRAAQSNKPKPIYAEAIKMLLKSDKKKDAEEVYQMILRKYKHCMSSWVNWATYHFEHNKPDAAREIFNKSLKSLVARKHLNLLNKFAQLEYRLGDAERGRTIFETLLGNHAKRTDIWFVYCDMELKYGQDPDRVRQLYERMISLDLNPTKMKPIFKRYLTFEASHGTPDSVAHVKTKASEYIALKSNE
jgi:rRNA biogenesis protein RRP5